MPRMSWDSSAEAIAASNEMLQLLTGEQDLAMVEP